MEITIKIEKEDEISRIKEILELGNVQVSGLRNVSTAEKRKELIEFLKSHSIRISDDFTFDREEANER